MKIEDFTVRAREILDEFKLEYRMFNASDPNTFPEEWDYHQWWEELYTFLLFRGVVVPEVESESPPDNIKYIPE